MTTRSSCTLTSTLALALVACAGAPPPGAADPSDASTDADLERLEELFEARTDSATLVVSEADVRFMTGMISHHAQALVMAGMAESHGASAEMLVLTGRVINAQQDEINVMQAWLRDRGRPVPEVEIDGTELRIDGGHPPHMHGMLSDEQMRRLDEARGREWDRLFLEFMIQHHEGAVMMVEELFATDGAANDDFTYKMASDIQVDQRTEIRRMKLMLEEMSGG